MDNEPDIEVIDGSTFELRPHHRTPTRKKWICLRKNREFTNRYLSLASEFKGGNIVEVGVDQGGGTSFFAKLLQPAKMIAIELSTEPVQTVMDFLSQQNLEDSVEIYWGVNQADRAVVPDLLRKAFGDKPLDLVVDDASHLLAPSTATFEMLFPRIRPGGLYILEDWSADHLQELYLYKALVKDSGGELGKRFLNNALSNPERQSPMSVLICQIAIASGRNPDWVYDVRITDGYCEVRRGAADIPQDTPIATYTGELGNWVFEQHTAKPV